jgi:hypothetical protein
MSKKEEEKSAPSIYPHLEPKYPIASFKDFHKILEEGEHHIYIFNFFFVNIT